MNTLCKCGCGTPVAPGNDFVRYHHLRIQTARKPKPPTAPVSRSASEVDPAIRAACTTDQCGQTEPARVIDGGWIYVLVAGSRDAGRWYCCGRCASYGMTLAELHPDNAA